MKDIKLDVPMALKNKVGPRDCALVCVANIMAFYKKDFDFKKFKKKLSADKSGFDIQEIAEKLIKKGYKVILGTFDDAFIKPKYFKKYPVSLEQLKNYTKTVSLDKKLKKCLYEFLEFYKKNPKSFFIQPLNLKILDRFLAKKSPILIHVEMSKYSYSKKQYIHSALVVGKKGKRYLLLDPLLGQGDISEKGLLKSWRAGGGYYLVVFKKRKNSASN